MYFKMKGLISLFIIKPLENNLSMVTSFSQLAMKNPTGELTGKKTSSNSKWGSPRGKTIL